MFLSLGVTRVPDRKKVFIGGRERGCSAYSSHEYEGGDQGGMKHPVENCIAIPWDLKPFLLHRERQPLLYHFIS